MGRGEKERGGERRRGEGRERGGGERRRGGRKRGEGGEREGMGEKERGGAGGVLVEEMTCCSEDATMCTSLEDSSRVYM